MTGDWEEGRKRADAAPGEDDDDDGAGEVELSLGLVVRERAANYMHLNVCM